MTERFSPKGVQIKKLEMEELPKSMWILKNWPSKRIRAVVEILENGKIKQIVFDRVVPCVRQECIECPIFWLAGENDDLECNCKEGDI